MEQIELVLRLPKKVYDTVMKKERMLIEDDIEIYEAIDNGTPLPKGHGRLIDADKLIKDNGLNKATKYGNETKEQLQLSYGTMMMYEIFDLIDDAEVVVEADKEGADNGIG